MLTLVDSLDSLVVMKEYDKFEDAVKHVIRGLSFDTDITVNLFEANIRILGYVFVAGVISNFQLLILTALSI
jgi:hypothetical protein